MKKKDLHDIFIEELQNRGIKKADLVYLISDILKLEKESAYRRLAGKVNFSVREMGILAKALNISLDSLLYQDLGLQSSWGCRQHINLWIRCMTCWIPISRK